MGAAERRILFLHIPKTAGTSLKRFLYHQLPAHACLMDPVQPNNNGKGALDGYQLVAGHLDYDILGCYRRRPFVLTCLRDPIDRALSAYYYQRTPRLAIEIRSVAAQIGEATAQDILNDLRRVNQYNNLLDFLRAEPGLARKTLGNVQTEYLAGAAATAANRSRPDRLLAVACEHLRACDGVLLVERLHETMTLIDSGWGEMARVSLRRDNTTPNRRLVCDHSPAELEALAELTSLDLDLYRYAEQLIKQSEKLVRPQKCSPDALPEAANYTFDQPIHGYGWHVRECRDGAWFCWTDREAAITLRLTCAGDHELNCELKYAASAEALSGVAVRVNGHAAALTSKPEVLPGWITARIPRDWLAHSPREVCIEFQVAHTVRPSVRDSSNPDTRRLGIAVSCIRFIAIGAR